MCRVNNCTDKTRTHLFFSTLLRTSAYITDLRLFRINSRLLDFNFDVVSFEGFKAAKVGQISLQQLWRQFLLRSLGTTLSKSERLHLFCYLLAY